MSEIKERWFGITASGSIVELPQDEYSAEQPQATLHPIEQINAAAARENVDVSQEDALADIAERLRKAGATLPAPDPDGTIESAMRTGLCVGLLLVETWRERLAAAPEHS